MRSIAVWAGLVATLAVPLVAAAMSPLLAWRQPVYIVASFAGILALALLVCQPLLAHGYLPGLPGSRGRRIHRWLGGVVVVAVMAHVIGLWITSPPDVLDALLFRSPTPFSLWGVVAMWAVFATATLAILRRRLRLRSKTWRLTHVSLAVIIVSCTALHALLIEGAMETVSKAVLCAAAAAATAALVMRTRS